MEGGREEEMGVFAFAYQRDKNLEVNTTATWLFELMQMNFLQFYGFGVCVY